MKLKKKISIFCGGSGSETIIKYFLTKENIDLTLLVNAYDDGKSTGKLRSLIPGFLGPSDFRKNFSYLINAYSESQIILKEFLDLRFQKQIKLSKFKSIINDIDNKKNFNFFQKKLNLDLLKKNNKKLIVKSLKRIYLYIYINKKNFDFNDCSIGNLVFAGIYLETGYNFNKSIKIYAKIIDTNTKIFNISDNDERKLIALNKNNELILSENKIVNKIHKTEIKKIYLIKNVDYDKFFLNKKLLKIKNIEKVLKKINNIPKISIDAKKNILSSDIIIYGPGTQHSSLFPSYLIASKVIKQSKAKKYFIMNLDYDKDIVNLSSKNIIDLSLKYLSDTQNKYNMIDKVLIDEKCKFCNLNGKYKNINIIKKNFRNNLLFQYHSGKKIYQEIFKSGLTSKPSLAVYINLKNINTFKESFFDEFFEIQWENYFSKITIIFNSKVKRFYKLKKIKNIEFKIVNKKSLFSEVDIFLDYLKSHKSDYLVTLSGDGFFKWNDIIKNLLIIKDSKFGLLLGSRNQDRSQHFGSINKLYGNNKILYYFSKFSELFISILYFLFIKRLMNDPITGMRIYNFSNLKNIKTNIFNQIQTPTGILKKLSIRNTEISESPVSYFTTKNFIYFLDRYYKNFRNIIELFI